jgi:hypothetical protein
MDYDQTEIAASYDKARVLAPETARLWQDLLTPYTHRAATSLIIDLGCGTEAGRICAVPAMFIWCSASV